ncbi:MAG: PKD domain-containing protein [Methylococcaceae bacterium]
MRINLYKCLLGALVLSSGSAHALIDNGAYGTPGELFISIYDASAQKSYYRDLGINLSDFLAQPAFKLELGSDTAFADFKSRSGLVYNVGAIYPLQGDLSNLERWGYLATSSSGDGIFDSGFNAVDSSRQAFQIYINMLNPRPFTGQPAEIAENLSGVFQTGDSAYCDTETWGESMGGLAGGNTTGKPGEPLPFFHINNQTGEATGIINRLGYWVLSGEGSLSFTAGSGNLPPVAHAGDDRIAGQGATVSLKGFESIDPDNGPTSLKFQWKQISGKTVNLESADASVASFKADYPGVFTFRLTVTDGSATAEDDVSITVSDAATNKAPVAQAGDDRTVLVGSVVTLNGANSQDPDHAPLPLTYLWSQISGTPLSLSDDTLANPVLTPSVPGVYVFQLTVNDGIASSVDAVTITVNDAADNKPPVADAGSEQNAYLSEPVTLDGSASRDPDNQPAALGYVWKQLRGPSIVLTGRDTAQPVFTPAQAGTYLFELTVNDGLATSKDTVSVTVVKRPANKLPVANAGADQTLLLGLGSKARLDGSLSLDPDASPNALTYTWSQTAGLKVKLNGSNTAKPTINLPKPGLYSFTLTVSDGVATATDTVTVYGESGKTLVPALASAGTDQTVTVGSPLVLDGSASLGSGPVTYLWTQLEGPVIIAINGQSAAKADVTLPKAGSYQFRLTATNSVGTSEDTVAVTAMPKGLNVQLEAPLNWKPDQPGTLTWHIQDIADNAVARILFSKEGKPFDVIARVSAGSRQLTWKPSSAQVTQQGVLRICIQPSKQKPQVCDSVGVVVQR